MTKVVDLHMVGGKRMICSPICKRSRFDAWIYNEVALTYLCRSMLTKDALCTRNVCDYHFDERVYFFIVGVETLSIKSDR